MSEENEQLYAIADNSYSRNITAGKPYPIRDYRNGGFRFYSDIGRDVFSLEYESAHLNFHDWRIVKESDLTDEQREMARLLKKGIKITGGSISLMKGYYPLKSAFVDPNNENIRSISQSLASIQARLTRIEESRKVKGPIDASQDPLGSEFQSRIKGLEETAKRHEYSLELQSKQDDILTEELEALDDRIDPLEAVSDRVDTLMEFFNHLEANFKDLEKRYNQLDDLKKADPIHSPGLTWGYPTREDVIGLVDPLSRNEIIDGAFGDKDGWIEHYGGERPVDGDACVDIKFKNGRRHLSTSAKIHNWSHDFYDGPRNLGDRVAFYRIAKAEPRPDPDGWIPWHGDRVWVITDKGTVSPYIWCGSFTLQASRDFLGIYPTREAAEEAAEKIKRVMEHWRSGGTVYLEIDHTSVGTGRLEGVKL